MMKFKFDELVKKELKRARNGHGTQKTLHEGYAVILEEVDEFWDWVKKKTSQYDPEEILIELVQVAAMAQRTAEDVVAHLPPITNKGKKKHGKKTG